MTNNKLAASANGLSHEHTPAPSTLPQRTIEELFSKGPVPNPRDNPEFQVVRERSPALTLTLFIPSSMRGV